MRSMAITQPFNRTSAMPLFDPTNQPPLHIGDLLRAEFKRLDFARSAEAVFEAMRTVRVETDARDIKLPIRRLHELLGGRTISLAEGKAVLHLDEPIAVGADGVVMAGHLEDNRAAPVVVPVAIKLLLPVGIQVPRGIDPPRSDEERRFAAASEIIAYRRAFRTALNSIPVLYSATFLESACRDGEALPLLAMERVTGVRLDVYARLVAVGREPFDSLRAVLRNVARQIDGLVDAGIYPLDANCRNIFIQSVAEPMRVSTRIIDFARSFVEDAQSESESFGLRGSDILCEYTQLSRQERVVRVIQRLGEAWADTIEIVQAGGCFRGPLAVSLRRLVGDMREGAITLPAIAASV